MPYLILAVITRSNSVTDTLEAVEYLSEVVEELRPAAVGTIVTVGHHTVQVVHVRLLGLPIVSVHCKHDQS